MLTLTLQSVFYCTAKHIEIVHQDFTIGELNFLIGHGNVETFNVETCKIFKSDNRLMATEEILEKLPKIIEFK